MNHQWWNIFSLKPEEIPHHHHPAHRFPGWTLTAQMDTWNAKRFVARSFMGKTGKPTVFGQHWWQHQSGRTSDHFQTNPKSGWKFTLNHRHDEMMALLCKIVENYSRSITYVTDGYSAHLTIIWNCGGGSFTHWRGFPIKIPLETLGVYQILTIVYIDEGEHC